MQLFALVGQALINRPCDRQLVLVGQALCWPRDMQLALCCSVSLAGNAAATGKAQLFGRAWGQGELVDVMALQPQGTSPGQTAG
jgi:hypothetical protein